MQITPMRRRLSVHLIAAAIVTTTALAWNVGAWAQAAGAATQSSSERGVTVKVTPRPTAAGAAEWEFAVVLDTHSGNIDDELEKTAQLVVDGREIQPIQWSGAAPGGHHREGVLKFAAPQQAAGSIELRIQRPNEAAPRVFRWDGAAMR